MTEDEFFAMVCTGMGWAATPWRLAVFREWHRHEGMPLEETWNPLATTRLSPRTTLNIQFDIGYGAGNWNAVPVRVYANAQAGINATVETLGLSYYVNTRRCFEDETGYQGAVPELATYVGSYAYGQQLVDFMRSQELPDPRCDTILQTLQATGIAAWEQNGNEPIIQTIARMQGDLAQLVAALPQLQQGAQQAYALNTVLLSWQAQLASQGIVVTS